MKRCLWVLVAFMGAVPCMAQITEDTDVLTLGAQSFGNLAIRQINSANDPVQQLREFFERERLPLRKDQVQKLEGIVEAQQKELRALLNRVSDDKSRADAGRTLNQEYMKLVNGVLTTEQQNVWRHYRVEQIRLRGGFPSLKAMLENAGVPLDAAQQSSIQKIFENFAARHARLAEANAKPAIADVDRLVIAEFNRVVGLLTPQQREALTASRRATSFASVR